LCGLTGEHFILKQAFYVFQPHKRKVTMVYCRLNKSVQITLIKPRGGEVIKGALVIPSYMAKGLEFDVVIVYDVNMKNYYYWSDFDKKLLYIACTRALHRLVIYYNGDKSPLI